MNTPKNPISTTKGWDYISAVYSVFRRRLEDSAEKSHIFPRYIYRGITKRYFTESINILSALSKCECSEEEIAQIENILSQSDIEPLTADDEIRVCLSNVLSKTNQLVDRNKKSSPNIIIDQILRLKCKNAYNALYDEFIRHSKITNPDNENNNQNDVRDESIFPDYTNYLQEIIENPFCRFTLPEQIRSGASVRLRDTDAKYTSVSDYIRYNKNLVAGFKAANPEYKKYTELEILAEIQHKGGGTCLVDFSTNFFISLWFACNNDFEDFGYLFCYDVNSDALLYDNITVFNKHRKGESIESLLLKSRKTTMYAGGDKFRFWLWKPDNINGRIARQDSIFVFGLEKFFIGAHKVDIIPIPPQWKRDILITLNTFFGITAETVYPDVDGFASSNSKISKISNDTIYFNPKIKINTNEENALDLEIIQRGMSCLLKGEYEIALNYFLKSIYDCYAFYESLNEEDICPKTWNDKDLRDKYLLKIEVLYSIGFCFKKVGDNFNACRYLNKAFVLCFGILTGTSLKENLEVNDWQSLNTPIKGITSKENRKFVVTKIHKITDDYMDILYDMRKYHTALALVNLLITNRQSLEIKANEIIKQIRTCLDILIIIHENLHLKNEANANDTNDVVILKKKLPKTKNSNDLFSTAIKKYLRLISIIISNSQQFTNYSFEYFKTYNDALKDFNECVNDGNIAKMHINNTVWIFSDLTSLINELFCEKRYQLLRNTVAEITAQIDAVQQSIRSRYKVQ